MADAKMGFSRYLFGNLPVLLLAFVASASAQSRDIVVEGTARPAVRNAEIFVQLGHGTSVASIAFSPDGSTVATASSDKTVRLWDVRTGRELRTLVGHSSFVDVVTFAPDGRRLASAERDATIMLWDVAAGRPLRTLKGHSDEVRSIVFAPDGRMIASGSADRTVKLWDALTGHELRTISEAMPVTRVAFSHDGQSLAVGTAYTTIHMRGPIHSRGSLKLWHVATGRELRVFWDSSGAGGVAFSPNGKILAAAVFADETAVTGAFTRIKVWDVATGRELHTLDNPGHGTYAFTPDGQALLYAGPKGFRFWDVATGRELRTINANLPSLRTVAFAPDRRSLAFTSLDVERDAMPKLLDIATAQVVRTFGGRASPVRSVAFAPDGRSLAVAGQDNALKLWDVTAGREMRRIIGHSSWTTVVAFAPDGRSLATGSYDHTVRIWEVGTGRELHTLRHPLAIDAVAFSPDGSMLASGSSDTVRIWDAATGHELRTFTGHLFGVVAVAFAPDGRTIASASYDAPSSFSPRSRSDPTYKHSTFKLWDASTGHVLHTFVGHSKPVRSLAFAPDGRTVASGSADGTVKLWDVATGRELLTLAGHTASVGSVAFASDGRTLASASADQTVKVWDLSTRRALRTLTGHSSEVFSVRFAPDGRTLASGSLDTTARLWDVASGKERVAFVSFRDGEFITITPEGYYEASSERAEEYLNVRIGNQVLGIGAFRERFYRPDLVKLALTGASLASFARLDQVKAAPRVEMLGVPATTTQPEISIRVRLTDMGGGIGDLRVSLNGSAVTQTAGRDVVPEGTARAEVVRRYRVRLVNGRNEVRVVAFNRDNSAQGNPAVAEIVAAIQPTRPALHGLVVGIQEFRNPQFALKYPVADARRFADTLRRHAAPLFSRIDLKVLTTPAETTRAGVLQALRDARQAVGPEDLFVFFVASHGTVDEGEYYLLTSNVGSASTERLKADAVSHTTLKELLANIPATKKLVVIDTCSAAALGDQLQVALLTRGLDDLTALKILSRAVGSTVLSASTSTQQAIEGYRGHGLLTWVIVEGLKGGADRNGDGFVNTLEIATYVDEQVPVIAERAFGRAQYPMVSPSGQGFPLAKVK